MQVLDALLSCAKHEKQRTSSATSSVHEGSDLIILLSEELESR